MLKEQITKNKKTHIGTVLKSESVAKDLFLISFSAPSIEEIKPGQFISILCNNLTMRRPFSVADFNPETKEVSVFFKLKGEGTKYISSLRVGDNIDFIGPLGNYFKIENKKALLIGAGVGFAPIFYLSKYMPDALCVGAFTSKADIPTNIDCDVLVTNDGSVGKKGTILDHLDQIIEEYKPQKIYSCGPEIVLKGIAQTGMKYAIETELAMEKIMACSIGVCRGCVIKVKDVNGNIKNATICKDGPVFKGEEVVWQ